MDFASPYILACPSDGEGEEVVSVDEDDLDQGIEAYVSRSTPQYNSASTPAASFGVPVAPGAPPKPGLLGRFKGMLNMSSSLRSDNQQPVGPEQKQQQDQKKKSSF